jgi:hypothetical protein
VQLRAAGAPAQQGRQQARNIGSCAAGAHLCSSSWLGVLRGSAWMGCILLLVTGLESRLRRSSPMQAILELCVSP